MQHYYSENPEIKSERNKIIYNIFDKNIELITEFSERLKGSKKTNLQEYIDYCIEICRIQHNI